MPLPSGCLETFISLFLNDLFNFLCLDGCCVHGCMPGVFKCLQRSEECIESPYTGAIGICELPKLGPWKKDSGPLEEKQVLKTVEPFPQHTFVYLFIQDAVTYIPGAVASFD